MSAVVLIDLPQRDVLTTREICAWRRITPETFSRRRKAGVYKLEPCDRSAQLLFNRDDVLRAFGVVQDDQQQTAAVEPTWGDTDADAYRKARSRQVRHRARTGGRNQQGAVRGAGTAPAARLAVDNTAAH